MVNKELKKINRAGKLPAGIVLAGGGAKLPGIIEVAKKEFRLSCRLAGIEGIAGIDQDLSLVNVCGLVLLDMEEKILNQDHVLLITLPLLLILLKNH